MVDITALNERRYEVAQEVFENMDFGHEIEDANGWELTGDRDDDSVYLSRLIFVASEAEAPSIKGTFKVEFDRDSAEPRSATAYIGKETIDWFPSDSPKLA